MHAPNRCPNNRLLASPGDSSSRLRGRVIPHKGGWIEVLEALDLRSSVEVCCSVLQSGAGWCRAVGRVVLGVAESPFFCRGVMPCVAVYCSVVESVAGCCSVVLGVAGGLIAVLEPLDVRSPVEVDCRVLQGVAGCRGCCRVVVHSGTYPGCCRVCRLKFKSR